ncbi:MAG: GDP-L-fucose synthase [bacterium]
MDKSSKIYIAGHKGLVGSALLRKVQASGYTNVVVKTSKELDLRKQAEVEDFFEKEKPEYVFLAAAKVGGILANSTYKAEFIYDNIIIGANVINSAYKYGVGKLLNLGSSCIYPRNAPQPMKEEHLLIGILEPTNEPYAIAKIAAIKLCQYYNEQYGTNFISGMPTNLYGRGDNYNLETAHLPAALIRKFHLAKLLSQKKYNEVKKDIETYPIGFNFRLNSDAVDDLSLEKLGITPEYVTLWGSGEPYREFLYVDDMADACLFLMENYEYKNIGEFINTGSGEEIKIKDIAKLIKDIVGFVGEIKFDFSKPDGIPRKLLDSSKIKSLGWKPEISLSDGIKKTYEYYISK